MRVLLVYKFSLDYTQLMSILNVYI